MVLISITSHPNDFLSAPPPGVFRRRTITKPVSTITSNGVVCNQHQQTNKGKNSLQILEAPKEVSPPRADRKEGHYEDLESKLLSIYAGNNEKHLESSKSKFEFEDEWKYNYDGQYVYNEAKAEGITLLMAACQQGLEHDVRTILRRKPSLARLRDCTGKTAMHYCADNQSTACLDQILDLHPTLVNTGDNEGYTPLILAVLAGNTNIIRHLVSRSASIDAVDSQQHSAVHWAVVCGELEALDVLCNSGAEINSPDTHGAFPIHYAAQMCGPSAEHPSSPEKSRTFLVVLRKLLARGADPNVLDKDLRPPVLWAASAGSADAFLALVNYGASPSVTDKDGLSALHCAASRGHRECLSILITLCGAAVNLRDLNGCTALFYTVTLGYVECSSLLLECGAQTDIKDRKGRTPVHCGAAKGQLETLKVLERNNAQMWEVNNKGETPLHQAVRSGRKDLIRWLLSIKPESVDEASREGRTALHVAASTNDTEVCAILLEWEADVNKTMISSNGKRTTPLDVALYRDNKSCARFLQSRGGLRFSKLNAKIIKRLSAKFSAIESNQPNDSETGKESNSSRSRNSKTSSKMSTEKTKFEDSDSDVEGSLIQDMCSVTQSQGKSPTLRARLIKSPFPPPPRSPFAMSDVQAEEDLPFQHFENINDENIGKKIMIEKHLQHQRLLEQEGSASFLSGKNSRCQSSEFDKFSVRDFSGNFENNKDISEIYKLNGTLKFPKNASITNREGLTKLSSKELRKLRQEKFYLDELEILRETRRRLKSRNCNVAPITRRVIDNFNKKIIHYVGCRTYTGPISQTSYEKHLVTELCKLQSVGQPSHLGKVARTNTSHHSEDKRLLVLPRIIERTTPASDGVLELRHEGVSKLVRLPQNNSQSDQQISVTFTIKPRLRRVASVCSLSAREVVSLNVSKQQLLPS